MSMTNHISVMPRLLTLSSVIYYIIRRLTLVQKHCHREYLIQRHICYFCNSHFNPSVPLQVFPLQSPCLKPVILHHVLVILDLLVRGGRHRGGSVIQTQQWWNRWDGQDVFKSVRNCHQSCDLILYMMVHYALLHFLHPAKRCFKRDKTHKITYINKIAPVPIPHINATKAVKHWPKPRGFPE